MMIVTERTPRLLRYRVPESEIAVDMPAILQIGTVFRDARTPTDLLAMASIRTRRMMEQPAGLDYDLDLHVHDVLDNLARRNRERMDVLRVSGLAALLHDVRKVDAPNGDHPKLSADYASIILSVLRREGFIPPEDVLLVASLVRWHHGLGDSVLGRDGVSESNIQRTFPTAFEQSALLSVVRADMSTWDQGSVWFKQTIEPALPQLLPKAIIYSTATGG